MSLLFEANTAEAAQPGVTAETPSWVPPHIQAANLHSVANGEEFSLWDTSTWGPTADRAVDFTRASFLTATNDFYNSFGGVAGFFGYDFKQRETGAWIASMDSNLGAYYEQNSDAISAAAFIGSAIIPGLGGVKLLHMGQKALRAAEATGFVGQNLARATGLLNNRLDQEIVTAGAELANRSATFTLINASTARVIGSGFAQAAWESAAFETAVAASLNASPVVSQMDATDLATNMMWGTGLGGVIGGAVNVARLRSGVNKALTEADKTLMPVRYRTAIEGTNARYVSDESVSIIADIERVKSAPFPETQNLVTRDTFENTRATTLRDLDNDLRMSLHRVARGDSTLGNIIADNLEGIQTFDKSASLYNLKELGRVGAIFESETSERILSGRLKNLRDANARIKSELQAIYGRLDDTMMMSADDIAKERNLKMQRGRVQKLGQQVANKLTELQAKQSVQFVRMLGDDVGETVRTLPTDLKLADKLLNDDDIRAYLKTVQFRPEESLAGVTDADRLEALFYKAQTAPIGKNTVVSLENLPALEAAYGAIKSGKVESLTLSDGTVLTGDNAYTYLTDAKERAMLAYKEAGLLDGDIARLTNVDKKLLDGTFEPSKRSEYYFGKQRADALHTQRSAKLGKRKITETVDTLFVPTYAKIAYDTQTVPANFGNITTAMANITADYNLRQEAVMRAVAGIVRDEQLAVQVKDGRLAGAILEANRLGSSPGLLSANNADYGTLASLTQNLGSVTARLEAHFSKRLGDTILPHVEQLRASPEDARTFIGIQNMLSATEHKYVLSERGLMWKPLADALNKGASSEHIAYLEGLADDLGELGAEYPIASEKVMNALRAQVQANGDFIGSMKGLQSAKSDPSHLHNPLDTKVLYPIRKDPRDFRHFAFVVDDSISGYGHVSMIHARDAAQLEGMIVKAQSEGFKTITDRQSKEWHKAMGDYDYSRTMNENHVDTAMLRKGISSEWLPPTDPNVIVDMWVAQHSRQYSTLAREIVRTANEREFAELEKLGAQFTGIATSVKGGSFKGLEDTVNNPYMNYVKTALNISQLREYPLLYAANSSLDKAFSAASNKIAEMWRAYRGVDDLDAINSQMKSLGVKGTYESAADVLLANATASRGELSKFVSRANGIVASLALRTDPFNALTNAVSSTILMSSESRFVVKKILKSGNQEAIAELREMGFIRQPGVGDSTLSAGKMMAGAYKEFFSDIMADAGTSTFRNEVVSKGWSPTIMEQHRMVSDALSVRGSESVSELQNRLGIASGAAAKIMDTAGTITGNKMAEEMNRYVAAKTADKLYALAVKADVLPVKGRDAFINTMVNRTQGNMMASQRPLMFQGAFGSALSLFQTYQFNFMQQLFRYVGEGSAKDAAFTLAMQGSLFGLNGLPAFNFINQSFIGNAAGNPKHRDLYTSLYGMTDKDVADFLMYGGLASLTGSNIYNRGDLNPRHLTILPSTLAEFPAIGAYGKVLGQMKEVLTKIGAGGDIWDSFLQGVEHNGLSRPLSGLAVVAQGHSTTNNGELMSYHNDVISLASLKRLAGGRPYDEAFMNDAIFRVKAYDAADTERRRTLREAVRSSVIDGGTPDGEQMQKFLERYVETGGKARNFNKFVMEQYKAANTPTALRIESQLKDSSAQMLQEFLGGREY